MLDMKMLGENIRHIRKIKGLTQEELAQKAGLSTMSIRRYENGERVVTEKVLDRIANALGVPMYAFSTDDDAIDTNQFPWWPIRPPHMLIRDGEHKYEIPTEEKTYRILSYGLRYSFSHVERDIVKNLSRLNSEGQQKAAERVKELTEIPRYQSQWEPTDLSILLEETDYQEQGSQDAPQSTPAPQESTDTTPPPDAPDTPPEGK